MNWMICINNKGYEASLESRKLYPVIADEKASTHGMIRVIDESGEGYLYDEARFNGISVSSHLDQRLMAA
ncbi:MAG: hypothetical protein QM533_10480 [Cytophagales bacterium]|nr:hypothetical protein [Cytophagales bacterium]